LPYLPLLPCHLSFLSSPPSPFPQDHTNFIAIFVSPHSSSSFILPELSFSLVLLAVALNVVIVPILSLSWHSFHEPVEYDKEYQAQVSHKKHSR
jgi:hypothetical protein